MGNWLQIKKSRIKSNHPLLISIPKRVVKLSVKRSRVRRLIKEAIRLEKRRKAGLKDLFVAVKGPVPDKVKLSDIQIVLNRYLENTSS